MIDPELSNTTNFEPKRYFSGCYRVAGAAWSQTSYLGNWMRLAWLLFRRCCRNGNTQQSMRALLILFLGDSVEEGEVRHISATVGCFNIVVVVLRVCHESMHRQRRHSLERHSQDVVVITLTNTDAYCRIQ